MTDARAEREFTELVDRHGPSVLAYLQRRVAIAEDAADLFNDVLLTAWRRWDQVPEPPDDRPWLFGVARNLLANHARSARRRTAATQALAQAVSTGGKDVDEPTALVLDVRAAIRALDPVDREILTLTSWEGLTSAEVATIVALPPSTVRARLARARAKVRNSVTDPVNSTIA